MNENAMKTEESRHKPAGADGQDGILDEELFDDSDGADVVLIEYGPEMGRARAFHPVPEDLRGLVTRESVLAVNPHEGVALYCRECGAFLNAARTGGTCPVCGETIRVLYFIAELATDYAEG